MWKPGPDVPNHALFFLGVRMRCAWLAWFGFGSRGNVLVLRLWFTVRFHNERPFMWALRNRHIYWSDARTPPTSRSQEKWRLTITQFSSTTKYFTIKSIAWRSQSFQLRARSTMTSSSYNRKELHLFKPMANQKCHSVQLIRFLELKQR